MTRCTKCGALAEKIYAFGSTAPAKTIFMCLCWAASEVGVPDEEFEEYRKGILRTLKDEARGTGCGPVGDGRHAWERPFQK